MSMPVQKLSAVYGVVFLLIAVLGFFLASKTMTNEPLLVLFSVNIVHNVVHAVFGVWGLIAARTEALAQSFAQIAGVIYLVLGLLGFFTPTGFGYVHLGGHNIWLHLLLSLGLLYFGFKDSLNVDALMEEE